MTILISIVILDPLFLILTYFLCFQEAALVDIVERGQSIGMSIEYSDEYLNVDKYKNLVASWAQAVLETLDQKE